LDERLESEFCRLAEFPDEFPETMDPCVVVVTTFRVSFFSGGGTMPPVGYDDAPEVVAAMVTVEEVAVVTEENCPPAPKEP
jgi:hypothetical protein